MSISSVIIKTLSGKFLAISSNAIQTLMHDFNFVSTKYELAKKSAVFFESMKIAAMGSDIKNIGYEHFDDKDRKILKIMPDSQSVEGKITNLIEYLNFPKKSYLSAKFGIFYNFKETNEFIRKIENYTRIQVAEGYDAPDCVSSAWRITITFKYNKKFVHEVRNCVSFYAINDIECLEILKSLEATQTSPQNKAPQKFGNTANGNNLDYFNSVTNLAIKTVGFSATFLIEYLHKEIVNLKQIKEQFILLIPNISDDKKQSPDDAHKAIKIVRDEIKLVTKKYSI